MQEERIGVNVFSMLSFVLGLVRLTRRAQKGQRRQQRVAGDAAVVVSLHPCVLRPQASPYWFSFSLVGRVHPRPFLPFYP